MAVRKDVDLEAAKAWFQGGAIDRATRRQGKVEDDRHKRERSAGEDAAIAGEWKGAVHHISTNQDRRGGDWSVPQGDTPPAPRQTPWSVDVLLGDADEPPLESWQPHHELADFHEGWSHAVEDSGSQGDFHDRRQEGRRDRPYGQ